jgi:hypothetical protein
MKRIAITTRERPPALQQPLDLIDHWTSSITKLHPILLLRHYTTIPIATASATITATTCDTCTRRNSVVTLRYPRNVRTEPLTQTELDEANQTKPKHLTEPLPQTEPSEPNRHVAPNRTVPTEPLEETSVGNRTEPTVSCNSTSGTSSTSNTSSTSGTTSTSSAIIIIRVALEVLVVLVVLAALVVLLLLVVLIMLVVLLVLLVLLMLLVLMLCVPVMLGSGSLQARMKSRTCTEQPCARERHQTINISETMTTPMLSTRACVCVYIHIS